MSIRTLCNTTPTRTCSLDEMVGASVKSFGVRALGRVHVWAAGDKNVTKVRGMGSDTLFER